MRRLSMKFVTCSNDDKSAARRGNLTFDGSNEIELPTPNCLLHTRHGLVPEMTIDLWEELEHLPGMVHAPMNTLLDKEAKLKVLGEGVAAMSRLPPHRALFLAQTDASVEAGSLANTKNGVSVWGKGGRFNLTAQDFSRFVRAARPQAFQMMCDNETQPDDGRKRCRKAVDRTMKFTELVLNDLKELITTDSFVPFGSVVGGWDVLERSRCAEFMGKLPALQGFVIDGFRSVRSRCLRLSGSDLLALLEESLRPLPSDRPRLLPAVSAPADVLTAVRLGFDLFDGAFPLLLTEAGWAWNFGPENKEEEWLDFRNPRWLQDFGPVSQDCSCFACRQHTRSYVSHLVATREILGRTLLMLHNSQQYFRFFKHLREAIDGGKFEAFAERVTACPADIYDFAQKDAGDS